MYRVDFLFFIGWKKQTFINYAEKHYDEVMHLPGTGYCRMMSYKNRCTVLIWTEKKTAHDVLAHECLHAVNWVLERAGVKLDPRNDEPQTYFLGNLVRQALKLDG